jgi:Ni/Fe-hydrogenase b-type cytochrome subunit
VSQVHFVAMYVFVLTTVARIYWAFFGAGSAALGGLTRHRDWRFFGLNKADIATTPQWIAYYLFLRKTKPHAVKYGSLQKLTYAVLFPLAILVMALSGFAMFEPTSGAMLWFANIFGGLNGVRLMHYMTMWILIVFFMIHLYLVIVEEPGQAAIMLFRTVPRGRRVSGDYPAEKSGGTAGQKA